MKVLIVGASGFVGKEVLKDALARGHEVTALLRNPDALANHERLRKVQGDALDAAAVRGAVRGQDAVIDADVAKGTKKIAMDGKVGMMITVPDSAKFLVDMLEDRTHIGKAPSVSN